MQNKKILLGFDPSFETMGVAIKNPSKKIHKYKLFSGDLFQCLEWLGQNVKMKDVVAVVENPALDSAVFGAWEQIHKAIKTGRIGLIKYEFNMIISRAQKVGENKAAAKVLIKMLAEKNVPIIQIAPSARQKAYSKDKATGKVTLKNAELLRMPTKTTKEQFAKLTGVTQYEGNTEHSRDAATLLHGKTLKWCELQLRLQEKPKERKKPKSMPSDRNFNFHLVKRKTS